MHMKEMEKKEINITMKDLLRLFGIKDPENWEVTSHFFSESGCWGLGPIELHLTVEKNTGESHD